MPKAVENFARDVGPADSDGRLDAPAFHRNKEPLSSVMLGIFDGRQGDVLEIGSGTGQHAVAFAALLPGLTFWPSDLAEEHIASIDAWRAAAGLPNVRRATRLDCRDGDWMLGARETASASLCGLIAINVIHIAPWAVAEAIFDGAARYLAADGLLIFYGPFKKDGVHTAESNVRFDAALRARNPAYGVRDLEDLVAGAARRGMTLAREIEMPANNLTLVFGK